MTTHRKKDLSIETLRGLAIILVVMGHVIGYDSTGGMRVEDHSFLRHLYYSFQYLRMPLFTAISGWVYAMTPVSKGDFVTFSIKKIRRIILPLLFVGGLYYVLQSLTPDTNTPHPLQDIWRILVFPYTFYWYLYALFLVFIVIAVIDINKLANSLGGWLTLLVVAMGILIIRDDIISNTVPNIWGFKNAIYLFPFFLIGIGIQRFGYLFQNKFLIYSMATLLIIGLIMQQLSWYKIINYEFSPNSGLGLTIGVLGVITLLHLNYQNRPLAWMGNFAYTIFLFHSFGTSGGRIILKSMGIHHTALIFFFSLCIGLLLPILAEKILIRYPLCRMLFLGRPMNKKEE